ncbi:hypothetical protein [Marasmitruncus massiliensis]|uniref:hypothetical protein n=1 Tax=Marasmitruncus massiliensis TaxID=1944642 RepID=UPI000C7BBCB0|nr:hypothetical protein [Marasmitruncus massiliensis]
MAQGKRIDWGWDLKPDDGYANLFIKNDCVNCDFEKMFSFQLRRKKVIQTYQEHLIIESFYNNEPNGSIETNIYSLGKDLKQFMQYGVAFSSIVYADLQNEIEKNYLTLPIQYVNLYEKKLTDDILHLVAELCSEYELVDGFYDIPVDQFNKSIQDSEYSDHDLKEIKKMLKDLNYTQCNTGRYSYLTRINEKPTRVMRIKAKELNQYISKKSDEAGE